MKARILLIGLIALGWTVGVQADTITYDAAADFSATSNPNGVWSYGTASDLVGPSGFTAFTKGRTWVARDTNYAGINAWDSGSAYDPSVTHNGTNGTIVAYGFTWTPGDLGIDSYGGAGSYVRWIAPEDGSADIAATFTDMGASSAKVYVFKNFAVVGLNAMSTAGGVSWSDTLDVVAGDIIDFAVSGQYGSVTKLDATVALATVPEPATLISVAIGMVGLLAYAWRKQQ